MPLDQNLVTVQWSMIGAFGVAVTLLAPRAEQYRHDYLQTGELADKTRADRWGMLIRRTPMMVLAGVCGLSVMGAQNAAPGWIGVPSEPFVLLIAPVVSQLGFVFLLARLVPKLPPVLSAKLAAPLHPLPASRPSVTQTTITFANESAVPLLLWWLDTTGTLYALGRDEKPIEIPPGRKEVQNSYDGHLFLIQTRDGTNVGIAEAKQTPSIVSITSAALNAALQEPQESFSAPPHGALATFAKVVRRLRR